MKSIVIVLLALAAGMGLMLLASQDAGYVMFKYAGWKIETSVIVVLIALGIIFWLLYLLFRSWGLLRRSPKNMQKWQAARKTQQAHTALTKGLIALEEGSWDKAERLLLRNVKHSDTPLLHYLAAARVAQYQALPERRDDYLRLAHETTDKADVAVGLVQAELQLAAGQKEQAVASLQHLRTLAPKHPQVLKNLQEVYADMDQWQDVQSVLPALKKRHILPSATVKELAQDATAGQLDKAVQAEDWSGLATIWRDAATKLRQTSPVLTSYVKGLIAQGEQMQSLQLIESFMRKKWSDSLVYLYGQIDGDDSLAQLAKAEKWLKKHPNNPWLLLSAGRLARKNQMWERAEEYLLDSISYGARGETYEVLAQVLSASGKADAASNAYQQGLALMVNDSQAPA